VSVLLVAMVIIGGLGSITGAALGAFFLFGVRRLVGEALGDPVWVAYAVEFAAGGALIAVLTRAQGGLAGLFFLPRDPVVQGIVSHDEEARGSTNGQATEAVQSRAAARS
jgi:hypothetical protein